MNIVDLTGINHVEISDRHGRTWVLDPSKLTPNSVHYPVPAAKKKKMLNAAELDMAARGCTSRRGTDQIRHWTKLGLLPVTGNPHPGTGRSVRYPESAIGRLKAIDQLASLGIDLIGKRKFVDKVIGNPELLRAASLLRRALVSA